MPIWLWETHVPLYRAVVVFVTSIVFTPLYLISDWFDLYIFSDWHFLNFFLVGLSLEIVLGIWKHVKLKTFNYRKLIEGVMWMLVGALVLMVLFNGILYISVSNEAGFAGGYIKFFYRFLILGYLLWSSSNSMFVISGGKFPPMFWMKRIGKYNKTGNTRDLLK